jgi:hypothetical protein
MIAARLGTPFVAALALALSVVTASPAVAASGDRDSTFGGDGRVVTNLTAGNDGAADVAIQTDGKIVAAGRAFSGETDGPFALAWYLG